MIEIDVVELPIPHKYHDEISLLLVTQNKEVSPKTGKQNATPESQQR